MNQIYLDNSATTPLDKKVLKAMMPYFGSNFANASSIHLAGSQAMSRVAESRLKLAELLGCKPEEAYFTSGATESDNMAVLGIVRALQQGNNGEKAHIIVSAIEHEAVIEPARALVKAGLAELDLLPVDSMGLVSVDELKKLIKPNTRLVSVMLANNEIGTIEPIAELGQAIAELNADRQNKIYFHTDATQAPAYVSCNVEELKVDLMSLSAHKINGPKGVGAIYVRKGTPLQPLVYGGGQEGKVRSGTYNVPGIVGFGKAIELISDNDYRTKEIKRLESLRDYLIKKLTGSIDKVQVTGDLKRRLPGHASFVINGVEGESVLLMLSQQGIMVSTGSACSSGSLDPSHVLLAIGLPAEVAHGSLRVTLGRNTKKSDIDALLKALPPIVEKLRAMSPLKNF